MLKWVKLGNMDKIDNIHDMKNLKNCDCMNKLMQYIMLITQMLLAMWMIFNQMDDG